MPRKHTTNWRVIGGALALGLPLFLAACGDDEAQQNFAPLTYQYLSQIHLNVAHIDIVDQAPPGTEAGDISAHAPTPPDQALQEMARDRLTASGSNGNAVFTITHASILHEPGGTLQGDMDVHIDIVNPSGEHTGFAQAHVSRTMSPGDQDPESRSVLYALTSQMMQDMNVELEYQIKKSLSDWLVDAGGTPLNGAIQQQDLSSSPNANPVSADPTNAQAAPSSDTTQDAPSVEPAPVTPTLQPATTTPAAPSSPDAIFPTGGDTQTDTTPATPQLHSPPQSVLKLPNATNG